MDKDDLNVLSSRVLGFSECAATVVYEVPGIEPRTSLMLANTLLTELHLRAFGSFYFLAFKMFLFFN